MWYVHNFLTKNFVSKEYLEHGDVRNNVRKWPNLCSIELWNVWKVNSEAYADRLTF